MTGFMLRAADVSWWDQHVSFALWLQGIGVVAGVVVAILVAYRELPRYIAQSRADAASERAWRASDLHVTSTGRMGTKIRITMRYVGLARLKSLIVIYGSREKSLAVTEVPGLRLSRSRQLELDLGEAASTEVDVERTKFYFTAKVGIQSYDFEPDECTWYEVQSPQGNAFERFARFVWRQVRYCITPPRTYVLLVGVLIGALGMRLVG